MILYNCFPMKIQIIEDDLILNKNIKKNLQDSDYQL